MVFIDVHNGTLLGDIGTDFDIASAVVDLVSSALDDLLKSKVSDFEATWDFTGRPEPWELTFEVALLGDNAVRGLSPGLSISVP